MWATKLRQRDFSLFTLHSSLFTLYFSLFTIYSHLSQEQDRTLPL